MANKKGSKGLPFALRIALGAAVKKNTKSKEEYETVMSALESLDLNTLLYDPEALARVMANPSGELRNYVKEGVDLGTEEGPEADGTEEDVSGEEAAVDADGSKASEANAEIDEANASEGKEGA